MDRRAVLQHLRTTYGHGTAVVAPETRPCPWRTPRRAARQGLTWQRSSALTPVLSGPAKRRHRMSECGELEITALIWGHMGFLIGALRDPLINKRYHRLRCPHLLTFLSLTWPKRTKPTLSRPASPTAPRFHMLAPTFMPIRPPTARLLATRATGGGARSG